MTDKSAMTDTSNQTVLPAPDIEVDAREMFGIDIDMKVPAFSQPDERTPDADDTYRPERARPYPKRCLVFSPEPQDAITGMGGTMDRLIEQGHDVRLISLMDHAPGQRQFQTMDQYIFYYKTSRGLSDEALQRCGDFDLRLLRRYHPGLHRVELLVNGETAAAASFELRPAA